MLYSEMKYIKEKQSEQIQRAIDTYGDHAEIAVACEEMNELSKVLLKALRAKNVLEIPAALKGDILEEVADVEIVLETLHKIFRFDTYQLFKVKQRKIERLENWLNEGKTLEDTLTNR